MPWTREQGIRLFEIPVYRVSPEKWQAEQDVGSEEILWEWEEAGINAPNLRERAYALYRNDVGAFEYNQVVAYLRLVWDGPGPVIKGYLTRVAQKRFTRYFRRSRPFVYDGKALELWFETQQTSPEMLAELQEELAGLTGSGGSLAGMFIDVEPFLNIGASVDWRRVVGLG
jgi:hypothetical protein